MDVYNARYITPEERAKVNKELDQDERQKEEEAVRRYLAALKDEPTESAHNGITIKPTPMPDKKKEELSRT